MEDFWTVITANEVATIATIITHFYNVVMVKGRGYGNLMLEVALWGYCRGWKEEHGYHDATCWMCYTNTQWRSSSRSNGKRWCKSSVVHPLLKFGYPIIEQYPVRTRVASIDVHPEVTIIFNQQGIVK